MSALRARRNSPLSALIPAAVLICAILATGADALAQKASGSTACELKDHADYTKKIREYTTAPTFSTELVDHLPWSSCVPAPDVFLHHIVGAPDVLDRVADINAYMRLLASKSPRVKVFSIGKSEEGREMLIVAVSDEQNIAHLDDYRRITARLADPRALNDAEAQQLIAKGKPIYWASGSIHSVETGSPEMLMELAYRLAVEDTPFIQKIRKDSIVLLTPVVETDGRDRAVDTYLYHKKHPDTPPLPLPWWGHYVSHDNNRDGMTLSLALSRNMMNAFLDWHATVFHDLHESVPYLYISTGTGPYNPWLDPITISEWQEMAYYEIEEMTKRGVIGVWTHGFYDGWAPNYMFYLANGHNSIGRFYETFGNGGADTKERSLPPNATSREWYRPNPPLPKAKWSARNNINMQESALLFGMNNVASNGAKFLGNFYLKGKRSIEKARREGPAAYVFPADDPRPLEQARLLNLLKAQGIEVHRATSEIRVPIASPNAAAAEKAPKPDATASSETPTEAKKDQPKEKETVFPAGSYVIRMDQPYSRMADMMLDTEYYNSRDPRSYDDTGWTLGALRNVKTARVTDTAILNAPSTKVEGAVHVAGGMKGSGKVYLIAHNAENALATLRFNLADVAMEAAEAPFEAEGSKFRAGTLIVRDTGNNNLHDRLEQAAKTLELKVVATSAAPNVKTHPIATPRIALMHDWRSTQNDGWFRIPLDYLKVPYTYIADTAVREMPDLRSKFDVIIIPPLGSAGSLSAILHGLPMRGAAIPWKNTPDTPNLVTPGIDSTDDVRGGLGYSGLANLEKFVTAGGLLVAVTSSATVPVDGGMTDMVGITPARALQAPGIVVLTNVEDKKSPIAYGYDDKLYVYFHEGTLLRVGTGLGGGGGAPVEGAGRPSGRGTTSDPDVIQGRQYMAPERPVKRTPAEEELYVSEESQEQARFALPPRDKFPRVVLRFAPAKDLLLSGMLVGGDEIAEKPAVIDVPHGNGHVVLFANNPMWRDETVGSYFLLLNAVMNWDHLDAGREPAKMKPDASATMVGGAEDQE